MRAPSLHDPATLADLKDRVCRLEPGSAALWGTLTAPRMLCHVKDQLRVALGDHVAENRSTLLLRTVVRFLVIHVGMEPPKGKIQTAPEMLSTQPGDWATDRDSLLVLLQRLADATDVAPHPAFGNLSVREWRILSARHLDYHLRQFGV